MIIEKIIGHLNDSNDEDLEIETIEIPYEMLNKDVFRATSNEGKEYGFNIDHKKHPLHNNDIIDQSGNHIVVIKVLPQRMIVIHPKDIDEMGVIAHLLGNTHKPISVSNGEITLEVDPVVENLLKDRHINYHIENIVLDEPLRYVNLTHEHHHD